MLQNVIDNAVKSMGEQGQPRIEIGARDEGGETVCYVRDNGIGVEARHQDEMLDLFVRLGAASDGSGVGLAQRVVKLHVGRIWVESEGAGRGSTFCFTLRSQERRNAEPRRA